MITVDEQELSKKLIPLKIIWSAMLLSLAMYLFVGLFVGSGAKTSMNNDAFTTVRTVFYGLSFIILFVTGRIRKFILSGSSQDAGQAGSSSGRVFQKYTTAMIVAGAMSESIGIFGLVLYILGRNETDLYVLLGISAAAMCLYRPKKDEVIGFFQDNQMGSTAGQ